MIGYRRAEIADADSIAEVHIASWLTTYRGLMPDAVLDNLSFERRRKWWFDALNDEERKEFLFVATVDEKIVGFANCGAEREGDPDHRGELYALYLLRDYQGRGIGRGLVKVVAQNLIERGFDSMLVWVLSTNPARTFYERLGGIYLRDKPIEFGDAVLQESAYGWRDARSLMGTK